MRVNFTKTNITAGSPINMATGTTTAPSASSEPVYATRVLIQALHTGTGLVYVMDGVRPIGRVPAIATDSPCELAAASASAPGGAYSDSDPNGMIDIRTIWIDVATTNDPVRGSYDRVI